jgi:hypothetical protein
MQEVIAPKTGQQPADKVEDRQERDEPRLVPRNLGRRHQSRLGVQERVRERTDDRAEVVDVCFPVSSVR